MDLFKLQSAALFQLFLISSMQGRLTRRAIKTKPESTIVWIGDSVTLRCISTLKEPMFWNFARYGTTQPIGIYNGEHFKDSVISDYSLVQSETGDEYSLVIKHADRRHAGRYECQDDDGFGQKTSVEVIVVSKETRFDENTKKCIIQSYGNVEPTINCAPVSNNRPKRDVDPPTVTYECQVCLNVSPTEDTPGAKKSCLNTTHDVPVMTSTPVSTESSSATEGNMVDNGSPDSPEEQVRRHPETQPKTDLSIIIPVVVVSAVVVAVVVAVFVILRILNRRKIVSSVSTDEESGNSKTPIYKPPNRTPLLELDVNHAPVHPSVQPILVASSS